MTAGPIEQVYAAFGFSQAILHLAPFIGMLACIAILPLLPATSHWWEKNANKMTLATVFALAGLGLYVAATGDWSAVGHSYLEYAAFLAMIAALYTVSGGIYVTGAFAGFPWVNTLFLGLGAILANGLGTTGASMVLLRPLLRANRLRKHKVHIVVFFIFAVSNCGGLLTPLGDPPLYLGFLRGVPFGWTLRLGREWLVVLGSLLFIFHLIDEYYFTKEDLETKRDLVAEVKKAEKPLHIRGARNFYFLAGILATMLGSSYFIVPALSPSLGPEHANQLSVVFQVVMMTAIAIASYKLTPAGLHAHNEFSFGPIKEVAALFFGIFGAMVPALAVLQANAPALGLTQPWQYFWGSGLLSSVLDNAPTYLTFATLAAAQTGNDPEHLAALATNAPLLLAAISCGSVMMGALTYIGNGPNFMVKAIAEHQGVKMPSFLGYMKWSYAVLVPIFLLVTWLFFPG